MKIGTLYRYRRKDTSYVIVDYNKNTFMFTGLNSLGRIVHFHEVFTNLMEEI